MENGWMVCGLGQTDKIQSMQQSCHAQKFTPRWPRSGNPGTGGQGADDLVLERQEHKLKPPPLHQVILFNDDYTPMEFVVMIIQEFFNKDIETATRLMLRVHVDGQAVCGIFSPDIATTKAEQVMRAARDAGHPLQCASQPLD